MNDVLWPLLSVEHFDSADLQSILQFAVATQVQRNWSFGEVGIAERTKKVMP